MPAGQQLLQVCLWRLQKACSGHRILALQARVQQPIHAGILQLQDTTLLLA
jgi:hypothetical protein